MKFFLVLILLMGSKLFAQTICEDDLYKKIPFKKQKIKICNKKITVDVADNESLRSVGLMCRDKMPLDEGMIFIFEKPQKASFWMKNTKLALSIAFFSDKKKLLNIEDMEPMDEDTLHNSQGKALYAIEMNKGWFKKNKITVGCKLSFE